MTTELVLLLCLSVFVSAGAFFGEKGPKKVFESSAPRLGARLEQNLSIGHEFQVRDLSGGQTATHWHAPAGAGPAGQL